MKKWAIKILVELFLNNYVEDLRRPDLFTQCVCYHSPGLKRFHQESSSRGEETIHKLKSNFSIFAKNDYNSAVNTHFWAWSKFNIFADFDPLKTNDSALNLSHQGGFVLGLLAGRAFGPLTTFPINLHCLIAISSLIFGMLQNMSRRFSLFIFSLWLHFFNLYLRNYFLRCKLVFCP